MKKCTGGVIWITGHSSAGKTVVARELERNLLSNHQNIVLLDGDQLRSILGVTHNFSKEERIDLALKYFRLCSHLSKQNLLVVISAVAMFDEVRQWFSENIKNNFLVYLRVPEKERIERDERTKKLYTTEKLDIYSEPDADADLIIDNFGENTPSKTADIIFCEFHKRELNSVDYRRSNHWKEFYRKVLVTTDASDFANECLNYFISELPILDLCCGNGRDSSFFASKGLSVIAVDRSESAIEVARQMDYANLVSFICCDANAIGERIKPGLGAVYIRFALHSLTEDEEDNVLASSLNLLETGGYLCIEARSINDGLARKGDVLSPSERIFGHYRRFIDLRVLVEKIERLGFQIVLATESDGFAQMDDDDPILVRVIARKMDVKI